VLPRIDKERDDGLLAGLLRGHLDPLRPKRNTSTVFRRFKNGF
jgi:hypothetical protein